MRIEMRPGRVVVRSPGGLPDGMTLDRLSKQSVPRNRRVIRTLRYMGIAEDAGRGVALMRRNMALNLMAPPEFEADDFSVTVTLRLGSEASPLERAWFAHTFTTGTSPGDGPYSVGAGELSPGIEPEDARLLVRAARHEITNKDVRRLLQLDPTRASRKLARLRDAGFLQQVGAGPGTAYALSPDIRRPAGIWVRGLDPFTQVLRLAAGRRSITNSDVRAAIGLDKAAATRILGRLVTEGQLERRGEKRGTHYVLGPKSQLKVGPRKRGDWPPTAPVPGMTGL